MNILYNNANLFKKFLFLINNFIFVIKIKTKLTKYQIHYNVLKNKLL